MPPDGTSIGYRSKDGQMWFAGFKKEGEEEKPAILFCEYPGNLINPALYLLVGVFEKETDRDFVLDLHTNRVTEGDVVDTRFSHS